MTALLSMASGGLLGGDLQELLFRILRLLQAASRLLELPRNISLKLLQGPCNMFGPCIIRSYFKFGVFVDIEARGDSYYR